MTRQERDRPFGIYADAGHSMREITDTRLKPTPREQALIDALRLALDTYDHITTEAFSHGDDKRARHAMRQALSEYEKEHESR